MGHTFYQSPSSKLKDIEPLHSYSNEIFALVEELFSFFNTTNVVLYTTRNVENSAPETAFLSALHPRRVRPSFSLREEAHSGISTTVLHIVRLGTRLGYLCDFESTSVLGLSSTKSLLLFLWASISSQQFVRDGVGG